MELLIIVSKVREVSAILKIIEDVIVIFRNLDKWNLSKVIYKYKYKIIGIILPHYKERVHLKKYMLKNQVFIM